MDQFCGSKFWVSVRLHLLCSRVCEVRERRVRARWCYNYRWAPTRRLTMLSTYKILLIYSRIARYARMDTYVLPPRDPRFS